MALTQVPSGMIADGSVTTVKIADANVTTAKMADASVTPAKLSQPFTAGTSVATTSGTSFDFTGIPSWVKRISVILAGITSTAALPCIQIGSGSIDTTGYKSSVANANGTNQVGSGTATNAFVIATSLTGPGSGIITLDNVSGNTWVASGTYIPEGLAGCNMSAGQKALSGTLDRLRFTTTAGTATFSAGTINIFYE